MTLTSNLAVPVLIGYGLTARAARRALADARKRGHAIAQAGMTTVPIGHIRGRFTIG